MKLNNETVLRLLAKTTGGVIVMLDNDEQLEININNIYDIIEGSDLGETTYVFVKGDTYFPSVDITVKNKGTDILTKAQFAYDYFKYNTIVDKSPQGLMKWILRVMDYDPEEEMFSIQIKHRG